MDNIFNAFCDPVTREPLVPVASGLANQSGATFEFLGKSQRIVDFIAASSTTQADDANLQAYNDAHATDKYQNFLSWLFGTFSTTEASFRADLLQRLGLADGMKVLVVGCGLGQDVPDILRMVGPSGEVHAQDISRSMVEKAGELSQENNACFSISNATQLPYCSRYFDVVFHFGGINLFGDMRRSIAELERVTKLGGRVVFGDEGIAAHLRGTEYADILINNIALWGLHAPMAELPFNATDISLSYLLGNCFYLVSFSPAAGLPAVNLDIPHAGARGGTARTRYFGRLEGVTEQTKAKVLALARERQVSAHTLLEEIIDTYVSKAGNGAVD